MKDDVSIYDLARSALASAGNDIAVAISTLEKDLKKHPLLSKRIITNAFHEAAKRSVEDVARSQRQSAMDDVSESVSDLRRGKSKKTKAQHQEASALSSEKIRQRAIASWSRFLRTSMAKRFSTPTVADARRPELSAQAAIWGKQGRTCLEHERMAQLIVGLMMNDEVTVKELDHGKVVAALMEAS